LIFSFVSNDQKATGCLPPFNSNDQKLPD